VVAGTGAGVILPPPRVGKVVTTPKGAGVVLPPSRVGKVVPTPTGPLVERALVGRKVGISATSKVGNTVGDATGAGVAGTTGAGVAGTTGAGVAGTTGAGVGAPVGSSTIAKVGPGVGVTGMDSAVGKAVAPGTGAGVMLPPSKVGREVPTSDGALVERALVGRKVGVSATSTEGNAVGDATGAGVAGTGAGVAGTGAGVAGTGAGVAGTGAGVAGTGAGVGATGAAVGISATTVVGVVGRSLILNSMTSSARQTGPLAGSASTAILIRKSPGVQTSMVNSSETEVLCPGSNGLGVTCETRFSATPLKSRKRSRKVMESGPTLLRL
jgi:hypothetical protein